MIWISFSHFYLGFKLSICLYLLKLFCYLALYILLVTLNLTEETEYWDEEDNDLDANFPPESPSPSDESEVSNLM